MTPPPPEPPEQEPPASTGGDLLSRQIAQRLRVMIAQDQLAAGERLRERALAEQLSVSRTPLREALKILAGDGLVTLLPNRGAVVTMLTPEEIQEKLDVLGLIEGFAGCRACAVAADGEIAEIRALHHEMLAAYERRDRPLYFRQNQSIHAGIVAISHNRTLCQVYEQLNRQLYRYRYQGSANPETWDLAIREHAAIVALLGAREGEKLQSLLQKHVHSTWERIRPRPPSPPALA